MADSQGSSAPSFGGGTNPTAFQGAGTGAAGQPGSAFPGAGRQGGHSPASQGGADVVDFQAMLEAMRGEGAAREQQFQQRYGELEGKFSKQQQVLDKIKGVFSPETPADPVQGKVAELEQQLDHYLAAAVDAERKGQPIPLTTNLAIQFFQSQIALEQERASHKSELAKINDQLKKLSNPENITDMQAYQSIDSNIISALDTIYGQGDEYMQQKRHQFRAIGAQISEEIKDLKQNDPDLWDVIRRDPRRQAKMVKHFVEQTIPPRARQLLQDDQIQREPMGVNELWTAFREAKDIRNQAVQQGNAAGAQDANRIMSQVRQEILSRQAERMAGRGPSANEMYR